MTTPQIAILAIFGVTLALFVSEKIRYDIVALGALFVCVLAGLVPAAKAFDGFSNDAVITVAGVLVMSRALGVSGAVDVISNALARIAHRPLTLLAGMTVLGAGLSAFMNNVGALALLLPIALAGARKGGFPPGRLLMPISFATMLGGMITLVGTPPNLLASQLRERLTGKSFTMFDFAPVGLAIAAVGMLYLVFVGWRLLPSARAGRKSAEEIFEVGDYVTEAEISDKSSLVGKTIEEFEQGAGDGVVALGLIHGRRRLRARSGYTLEAGDVLLLQAETAALQELIKAGAIRMVPHEQRDAQGEVTDADVRPRSELDTVEVVVTPTSWIQGNTARGLRLRNRFDANLLAISRRGRPIATRLRDAQLFAGDVLLLEGRAAELPDTVTALGCLPLASRNLKLEPRRVLVPFAVFAGAILLVVSGALLASLALRTPFKVDVLRDRASLARIVDEGRIENVYRLQIMNASEQTQRYEIDVEGGALHDARIVGRHEVEVGPAQSRWVPVAVQLPYDAARKAGPGAHRIEFKIEQKGDGDAKDWKRVERSTFVVPR